MSDEFLNFIRTVSLSSKLDDSIIFNLILESNFTPSQICDNCIELFLQLNFTGPVDSKIEESVNASSEILKFISDDLTCEGEVPFVKTKGLILLWIAKCVSEKMRQTTNIKSIYKSCLNYLKCIYFHQATLRDERSSRLKSQMQECFKQAVECKKSDTDGLIDELDEFQLLILASHLHLIYYEYRLSEQLFHQCQSLLGISTELKGALGKRTRFQVDNVSQLYLEVRRENVSSASNINDILNKSVSKNLPNDHLVDDEVLLDETSFVDDLNVTSRPSLAEQALLVLQAEIHKLSRAKDEVTMEECSTILATALGSGNSRESTWPVVSDALLQRCQLNTKSSRRTERALMQLEELSNQFAYSIPAAEHRRDWFFLSRMPSIWELQLKLARVLTSMGMIKSALDVLLPWDQWPAIIDCLIHLGQRERAERMIRERIEADGETAELLCCLGDVTKDRAHYERAWIVSKERSARAMRSLAIHFMFVDMNHERASECFESSLRINTLQVNTWFTYGCCCLQMKSYRKAIDGFKQCLRLEPDNFEAWNNCASAHVELGEPKNALALLKEATKYSYENWRVWDNICIVSASVGDFTMTIKGYHRVMDLKEQHRDPATLAVMVRAFVDGTVEGGDKLLPKLKELFARIASKDGRDPRIWTIYADLLAREADQSEEIKVKVLQCLSRAHHGMCLPGWELDPAQCKRVIIAALRLVDRSIDYDVNHSSAKLAVKSVQAVMKNFTSSKLEELDEDVRALLAKIDEAESILATKA